MTAPEIPGERVHPDGHVTTHGAGHPLRTKVYRVSDGQPHECWTVDARELIATGEYTAEPPE